MKREELLFKEAPTSMSDIRNSLLQDLGGDSNTGGGVDDPPLLDDDDKSNEPENLENSEPEENKTSIENRTEEELKARFEELAGKDSLTEEEENELDSLENELLDEIGFLKKNFGIDELSNADYENDAEGFIKLSKDAAEIIATRKAEASVLELHNQHPLLGELYNHLIVEGKGEDSFRFKKEKSDFEELNVEDETHYDAIIRMNFLRKGYSESEIKDLLDVYESKEVKGEKAKLNYSELKEAKDIEVKEREKLEFENNTRLKEEQKAIESELKKVFSTKKIANLNLSDSDAKEFQNHLFGQTKDGIPNSIAKAQTLTPEKKLLLEYLIMKDFSGIKGLDGLNKELQRIKNQEASDSTNKRKRILQFKGKKTNTVKEQSTDRKRVADFISAQDLKN